jgi:hypothetical protein
MWARLSPSTNNFAGGAEMVIFKVLAWVLSLAAVVTWLVALVRWDGSIPCDRSQCESCPFPRCHENGQDSTGQE